VNPGFGGHFIDGTLATVSNNSLSFLVIGERSRFSLGEVFEVRSNEV
jgi:hypothetical protein